MAKKKKRTSKSRAKKRPRNSKFIRDDTGRWFDAKTLEKVFVIEAKDRFWTRRDDGVWLELPWGTPDPKAMDMTLSNIYLSLLEERGPFVLVPYEVVEKDNELAWVSETYPLCVDETKSDDHSTYHIYAVPRFEWDIKNFEIGVLGLWHPDIANP